MLIHPARGRTSTAFDTHFKGSVKCASFYRVVALLPWQPFQQQHADPTQVGAGVGVWAEARPLVELGAVGDGCSDLAGGWGGTFLWLVQPLRYCRSAAPFSQFSRCFNRIGERVSVF